jgi:hypothetical protein
MNFEEKYLKYKYKYVMLKNNNKLMYGGMLNFTEDDIKKMKYGTSISTTAFDKLKKPLQDFFEKQNFTESYKRIPTHDEVEAMTPFTEYNGWGSSEINNTTYTSR